jgi:prepilin-type N-terminal cleavage/methylation domain-containing protein
MHPARRPPAPAACRPKPRRTLLAFTLVEMLVVLGIIVVLAAIAFPVTGAALDRGAAAKDLSNLKQIGIAFATFASDNNNRWPHISIPVPNTQLSPAEPAREHSIELLDRAMPPDSKFFRGSLYNWTRRPLWFATRFAAMPKGKSFTPVGSAAPASQQRFYWGLAYGMNFNLYQSNNVPASMRDFGGYISKVPDLSKLVLMGERNREGGQHFVPGRAPLFERDVETEYRISRNGGAYYMFGDYHIELIKGDQSSVANPHYMRYSPTNRLYYAW